MNQQKEDLRPLRERFFSTDSTADPQGDALDQLSLDITTAIRTLTNNFINNYPEHVLKPNEVLECIRVAAKTVVNDNFSKELSQNVRVTINNEDKSKKSKTYSWLY